MTPWTRSTHCALAELGWKTFAAEDFASYLQVVPGIFISLGTRNQKKGIVEINHSCAFDIDEEILLKGSEIFHTLSLDFLKQPEKYLSLQKYHGPQEYIEKT